jgi:hypothetical protein
MRRAIGWIGAMGLAWAVVLSPAVAEACAVCTAGRDEENAFAFLMTTIFMSIMPLVGFGTLVFVLWRRMQKLEREREEASLKGLADPRPSSPDGAGAPAVAVSRSS